MPNEPLPNEVLALSKKTYAMINHNLLCHKLWLWMRSFAVWFVNLGLALCSVNLVTLKEKIVGEIPSFTNHAGIKHKLRGEKSYPKELQTRASPSPNLKNRRRCFHQFWGPSQICSRKKHLKIRSSIKCRFQHIQDRWIGRPVQGDTAKTLSDVQSEISFWIDCSAGVERA
jgi:hypothetical protein